MSTPGQQLPMMDFECVQCHGPVKGQQPILRIFNAPDVSTLISIHNKLFKCPGCGLGYVCLLGPNLDPEGKLVFMWQPVQTKDSAIAPGTNSNLQAAVQANELAGKIKLN